MEQIQPREIEILLADGPCRGTHARVRGFGEECWQRLDDGHDVWCLYFKNLYVPGEYVWSGQALTTEELKRKLSADTENTYEASEAR